MLRLSARDGDCVSACELMGLSADEDIAGVSDTQNYL